MATDTIPAPPAEAPDIFPPAGSRRALKRGRIALADPVLVAGLVVLVAISLLLRIRSIHLYYWVDEGLSVGIASHHFTAIPGLLRQDGSPPLYYLLLHVWMSIFGRGEVTTHVLSLIFALLTVPVAFWAGSSLFDRRVGWFCAILAATVPYLTMYAQETRMYALLALLALIFAWSLLEVFVRRRRGFLPAFVVSLTASMYTHNWALFMAVMSVVAVLVCVWQAPRIERRGLWRDAAIAYGATAILYAPWLPTLAYQSHHTGAPWDLAPVFWNITQGLYWTVGGRGAAIAILLAGGAGLLTASRLGAHQRRVTVAAWSLLLLGIGTLFLAFLYSKITVAWADRYFAVVVAPLILLFGLGLARGGRLAIVALVLCLAFWILDPVPHQLNNKSNVASVVAKLRPHLQAQTVVLSPQPEEVPTIEYYFPAAARYVTPIASRVPDPRIMDWRDALTRFRHANDRAVLRSVLASMTPGQRILLMDPQGEPKVPLWMQLIRRASFDWTSMLEHDHGLVRVGTSYAHLYSAGVAVAGTVYAVR
jgi:mannosyltransferase